MLGRRRNGPRRGCSKFGRPSIVERSWQGCVLLHGAGATGRIRRAASETKCVWQEALRMHRSGLRSVSPTVKSQTRWRQCEAYLSTKCPEAVSPPRIPPSYVLAFGADDHQEPSSARPGPVVSLIDQVTDRGSFVALRHSATRVRRGVLRIAFVPDESGQRRIAYALSRRVGNAVVRNRIRRRLRSVFTAIENEHAAGHTPFPPGTYLVSASSAAADVPFQTLLRTAMSLLSELDRHGASR